ncbi:MAG: hypothetical protein E6Q99_09440 [Elusimicrobia bacterium]|nr:MAG: hypothetical protein E6Q99_09440 [Elusimicrobiota bacterium]
MRYQILGKLNLQLPVLPRQTSEQTDSVRQRCNCPVNPSWLLAMHKEYRTPGHRLQLLLSHPPLPLAGEGWGEGGASHLISSMASPAIALAFPAYMPSRAIAGNCSFLNPLSRWRERGGLRVVRRISSMQSPGIAPSFPAYMPSMAIAGNCSCIPGIPAIHGNKNAGIEPASGNR